MRAIKVISLSCLVGLAFALVGCRGEREAAFPTKAVELVVAFPAGGSTDQMIRPLAEAASSVLGQQVVVVNKPGGNGTIGTGEVARARPDGYTVLVMQAGPGATQPHQGDVPYKIEDFEPLMLIFRNPLILGVGGHTPWKSVAEFVENARKRPGEIKFGASPVGGLPHLVMVQLERAADVRVTTVPYQGMGQALPALMGGHIDAVSAHPADVVAHLETGNLRLLGAYQPERLREFPELPTMKEQGYDVVGSVWGGLVVPKGTPKAVQTKLHDAFKTALESRQLNEAWGTLRISPSYAPADEFLRIWKEDFDRFGPLIRELKQAGVLQ
jgi:tripartite-type tricarboxylate transporter receptor subunit TctC